MRPIGTVVGVNVRVFTSKGKLAGASQPQAVVGLDGYGLRIVERVPIQVPPNENNARYLKTKKDKLGHLLDHMD